MYYLFQSLTGSIHTLLLILCWLDFIVSIPHRFNSHRRMWEATRDPMMSFNPSQVQFTPKSYNPLSHFLLGFNPSQVQFTRLLKIGKISPLLCFNPSQVQFTHYQSHFCDNKLNRFQSLTGSIHTHSCNVKKFAVPQFQSLTGSIHTMTRFGFGRKNNSFNPSQVQFTQDRSKTLTKPNSHTKI